MINQTTSHILGKRTSVLTETPFSLRLSHKPFSLFNLAVQDEIINLFNSFHYSITFLSYASHIFSEHISISSGHQPFKLFQTCVMHFLYFKVHSRFMGHESSLVNFFFHFFCSNCFYDKIISTIKKRFCTTMLYNLKCS